MKARITVLCALLALVVAAFAASSSIGKDYHVVKTIRLGGEGGWDYLTFDKQHNRLFITRATHVMVVDPATGKNLGDIPETPGVHGVALAPEIGRGFTSNGMESTVSIFDLKSLKLIQKVKTDETPDAIAYDAVSKRVFTFNARGHDTTAIDAADGKPAGNIPLGGKPEFAVADGKGHIYVNIEDKSELVALDTKNLKELSRWPLAPCESPSGMAIDMEHRRLFVGCHNKMMVIVDPDTGKVVTTVPIGQGVDANRFDPGTQLAFSSNWDGTLTVVHEDLPDKYTVVQNVETAKGARTMDLDARDHKIYLVTAQFGPAPAPTAENPHPRPTMVPDSFELLVVSPK